MPSQKSARTAQRKAERNRPIRTSISTHRARARQAIEHEQLESAEGAVREASSLLDRAARKRIIHPNKAARHKSQLAKTLNAARAQKA